MTDLDKLDVAAARELGREKELTAKHHRMLRTTRRNCIECWRSDRAALHSKDGAS